MATSHFDFYSRMFAQLSGALNDYVTTTATRVSDAISPVAKTLIAIYAVLWGWSMMRGVIQEPITDGLARILRLSVITGVALNMGYYNEFLLKWLWESPDALAGVVTGSSYTGDTNATYLDQVMSQMYDFGDAYYQKANADTTFGIPDIGLLITGIALMVAGLVATGYGAFLLALAKMGLAVTLGVGPLFVLLTIFEPTKRFFDSWMGQTLNYVFLVMLTAATIKLIMSILVAYLGVADIAKPAINQALPAIIFSVIATLALIQMSSIASALGGGVAIGTLGAVGWAYGKAKGGMSSMSSLRPSNIRKSVNRQVARGKQDVDAVRAAVGAPKAVYRKITGAGKNRVANGG